MFSSAPPDVPANQSSAVQTGQDDFTCKRLANTLRFTVRVMSLFPHCSHSIILWTDQFV